MYQADKWNILDIEIEPKTTIDSKDYIIIELPR